MRVGTTAILGSLAMLCIVVLSLDQFEAVAEFSLYGLSESFVLILVCNGILAGLVLGLLSILGQIVPYVDADRRGKGKISFLVLILFAPSLAGGVTLVVVSALVPVQKLLALGAIALILASPVYDSIYFLRDTADSD